MLDIDFMLEHTGFFREIYMDVFAVLLLLFVVVFYFVRRHQMKETEKDLEDEISDAYAESESRARGSY